MILLSIIFCISISALVISIIAFTRKSKHEKFKASNLQAPTSASNTWPNGHFQITNAGSPEVLTFPHILGKYKYIGAGTGAWAALGKCAKIPPEKTTPCYSPGKVWIQISEIPDAGTPWDSSMPVWEKMLTEDEMWSAIAYMYDYTGYKPRKKENLAEAH